ncbi:MAG TPA: NUDIX domain-containing protein [Symbiobacteriaceae bacterium]|nr:NUDIX domain-containing protein [Symbiobacteriaceae bacterium]
MLRQISELPADKRIAGVHVVPFTDDGQIVMGWNRERGLLETIGGRIEARETIEQALQREAREEAGVRLVGPFTPFASWYWESTDTYTVWFVARVAGFEPIPDGFETTGRVVCNVETAQGIIQHLAADPARELRLTYLAWAASCQRGSGRSGTAG